MSGELMLALNQLQLALAVPNLSEVQRARFQARLEELREYLPKARPASRPALRIRVPVGPTRNLARTSRADRIPSVAVPRIKVMADPIYRLRPGVIALVVLLLAGCATTSASRSPHDPLEP